MLASTLPTREPNGAPSTVVTLPAGFLDDQRTGGDVPGLKLVLPERVEASRRHVAEVERGRAEAAYGAGARDELAEQRDELRRIAMDVVVKAGDQQGVEQAARHSTPAAARR